MFVECILRSTRGARVTNYYAARLIECFSALAWPCSALLSWLCCCLASQTLTAIDSQTLPQQFENVAEQPWRDGQVTPPTQDTQSAARLPETSHSLSSALLLDQLSYSPPVPSFPNRSQLSAQPPYWLLNSTDVDNALESLRGDTASASCLPLLGE